MENFMNEINSYKDIKELTIHEKIELNYYALKQRWINVYTFNDKKIFVEWGDNAEEFINSDFRHLHDVRKFIIENRLDEIIYMNRHNIFVVLNEEQEALFRILLI